MFAKSSHQLFGGFLGPKVRAGGTGSWACGPGGYTFGFDGLAHCPTRMVMVLKSSENSQEALWLLPGKCPPFALPKKIDREKETQKIEKKYRK